jgi:hypothetical protein
MGVELFTVYSREKFEHNTDPLRRCYNGAHKSSEWRWSEWRELSSPMPKDAADESVARWRSIGRPTCQFKAIPVGEKP